MLQCFDAAPFTHPALCPFSLLSPTLRFSPPPPSLLPSTHQRPPRLAILNRAAEGPANTANRYKERRL